MQDGYTHIRSQRLAVRRLLLRVLGVLVRGAEVNLAGVHRGALRGGARSSRGGGREEGRCDGDGAMGCSCHYWLAGSSVLSREAATLCTPTEVVDGVCCPKPELQLSLSPGPVCTSRRKTSSLAQPQLWLCCDGDDAIDGAQLLV